MNPDHILVTFLLVMLWVQCVLAVWVARDRDRAYSALRAICSGLAGIGMMCRDTQTLAALSEIFKEVNEALIHAPKKKDEKKSPEKLVADLFNKLGIKQK